MAKTTSLSQAVEPSTVAAENPVQVPPVGESTEAQLRGQRCVWCAEALDPGRCVDLGERVAEDGYRCFPRACPVCTVAMVHAQLVEHSAVCEQCADNGALCPDTAELRRALREGRRL
ncbi:hypothetical protein [Streptomyces beihaiensis]|uniref:Ferredoxin n=1 Tax=Streptomyces beihaiensis TaxID=2984495 RepID=A0ABT3TUW8_9ACTN|nr:hypothetical protein [Streptomyces beihaiensis]MCX3060828.1 hypothetical protein [Streptomyces beihaiensis]